MIYRARARTIAHSWARRLRPTHRNEQHLIYESLHNHTDEPGLTGIDSLGTVRNDGLDIAWYEVGPQDADITVVFIHGYCLSAESYYSQVDYIRRHFPEVRCLLVDIRGHGLSTEVTPRSARWTPRLTTSSLSFPSVPPGASSWSWGTLWAEWWRSM